MSNKDNSVTTKIATVICLVFVIIVLAVGFGLLMGNIIYNNHVETRPAYEDRYSPDGDMPNGVVTL